MIFNPHLAKIALQYLNKGSKVYVEKNYRHANGKIKMGMTVTQQRLSYHNAKANCICLMQKKSNQHPLPLHPLLLKTSQNYAIASGAADHGASLNDSMPF